MSATRNFVISVGNTAVCAVCWSNVAAAVVSSGGGGGSSVDRARSTVVAGSRGAHCALSNVK